MGIRGIDHIEIWARDLEESVAFYTETLGFRQGRWTVAKRPGGAEHHQACVILGDMMIELILATPERAAADEGSRGVGVKAFALTVDDMAETAARLRERGVQFVQEPKPGGSFYGWRAEILDPNGIGIELREWVDDSIHNPDWAPADEAVTRLA